MNLSELATKVEELEVIRGFSHETIQDKMDAFDEEIYEFYEAVEGRGSVAEEGADVINTVIMIFKRYGIDADKALNDKIEKDKLRV